MAYVLWKGRYKVPWKTASPEDSISQQEGWTNIRSRYMCRRLKQLTWKNKQWLIKPCKARTWTRGTAAIYKKCTLKNRATKYDNHKPSNCAYQACNETIMSTENWTGRYIYVYDIMYRSACFKFIKNGPQECIPGGGVGGALNKEFLTESTDKPKGYMFKLVAY
jgi:hypothetical protein